MSAMLKASIMEEPAAVRGPPRCTRVTYQVTLFVAVRTRPLYPSGPGFIGVLDAVCSCQFVAAFFPPETPKGQRPYS